MCLYSLRPTDLNHSAALESEYAILPFVSLKRKSSKRK